MAARPVLLVHGFASSFERNWREPGWVDILVESGRTVIELDLPGHGKADKPHDPEAYADLAADVASAIPVGEVVDAIGFSMGARLLLEVAAAEPERFGRVVIAGVGAGVFQEGDGEASALAVERGGVVEGDSPTAQAFSVFARAEGNDPAALAACLRRTRPPLRAEDLANLRRPVLVVLGTKDFAGPAGPLLDALPDARLVELAGADHFGTPKDFRFIDAAVAFLEEGTAPPEPAFSTWIGRTNQVRAALSGAAPGDQVPFAPMGRGARSTVRWTHDRIRRKKARDARVRAAKAEARKTPS